jgi:RNA polymerase sigma-70 factor (ECF subfamily)
MALNLCFYEGLSNAEAADVMGIRLKSLQSLIMRGKATLKNQFNILEENDHE